MSTAIGQNTEQPTEAPVRNERSRRVRDPLAWVSLVVVAVLATCLVALHIDAYRQLSIYDEPQHIDYVNRLLEGEMPSSGDIWVPATVASATCRTIDYPIDMGPCADEVAALDMLPNRGLSMAFIHSPAYYLVPAGAVVANDAIGAGLDDVDVMRATGALWLVAALWLLWLLWRDFGVPWQTRAGLSLALTAAPVVLLSQSTVTNDATALAAGAALTVATVRWDRGSTRIWLPVGVALLALLLKATSLGVLMMACVFILVRAAQRSASTGDGWRALFSRRNLVFVGALAAATVVVGVGWSMIVNARATLDQSEQPQNAAMAVDSFHPSVLTTSLMSLMSPLEPQFYASVLTGLGAPVIVANLANVGLLVLAVIGAVRSEPGSVVRALAISVGAATLLFGPVLTIVNFVTSGVQFGIPARYGLSLVPAMLAVAGTAVRTRRGGSALLVVGAAFYAAIAWSLVS